MSQEDVVVKELHQRMLYPAGQYGTQVAKFGVFRNQAHFDLVLNSKYPYAKVASDPLSVGMTEEEALEKYRAAEKIRQEEKERAAEKATKEARILAYGELVDRFFPDGIDLPCSQDGVDHGCNVSFSLTDVLCMGINELTQYFRENQNEDMPQWLQEYVKPGLAGYRERK